MIARTGHPTTVIRHGRVDPMCACTMPCFRVPLSFHLLLPDSGSFSLTGCGYPGSLDIRGTFPCPLRYMMDMSKVLTPLCKGGTLSLCPGDRCVVHNLSGRTTPPFPTASSEQKTNFSQSPRQTGLGCSSYLDRSAPSRARPDRHAQDRRRPPMSSIENRCTQLPPEMAAPGTQRPSKPQEPSSPASSP